MVLLNSIKLGGSPSRWGLYANKVMEKSARGTESPAFHQPLFTLAQSLPAGSVWSWGRSVCVCVVWSVVASQKRGHCIASMYFLNNQVREVNRYNSSNANFQTLETSMQPYQKRQNRDRASDSIDSKKNSASLQKTNVFIYVIFLSLDGNRFSWKYQRKISYREKSDCKHVSISKSTTQEIHVCVCMCIPIKLYIQKQRVIVYGFFYYRVSHRIPQ